LTDDIEKRIADVLRLHGDLDTRANADHLAERIVSEIGLRWWEPVNDE
jgi:hypothetical protein